jgi:hypothetical protein
MKKYTLLIFLLICGLLFSRFYIEDDWTLLTSRGGIYTPLVVSGQYLIYGTNYSTLYIVNKNNPDKTKTLDLNTGTAIPQFINKNIGYIISRESLYKIDLKSSEKLWVYANEKNYDLDRAEIHGKYVFITDKSGSLTAIDKKSGYIAWKYAGKSVENLNSRLIDNNLYYAPDFWVIKNKVYVADRGGVFSVLNYKDGSRLISKDFKDGIVSNITIKNNNAYLFTSSGSRISLNTRTGKLNWEFKENTSTVCSTLFTKNPFTKSLISINNNGELVNYDLQNGEVIWRTDKFGTGVNCPHIFSKQGIFTHATGSVFKIDMYSGKTKWKKDGFGKIVNSPLQVKDGLKKYYIVADLDSNLTALDYNGNKEWVYKTDFPIFASPLYSGGKLFVPTSNGTIYKINLKGKAAGNKFRKNFSIETEKRKVGKTEIFEITLNSQSVFNLPWTEGELFADFEHANGRKISLPGFYFDQNIWKVRFNPPEPGLWKYKLTWKDHGLLKFYSSDFESATGTATNFLKINNKNPRRLTIDGNTVFNGIGIQEIMWDNNINGTPLDDWATGESESVRATSSAGVQNYFKSNKPVNLDEYIKIYGPEGAGVNIYRLSLMNGNTPLYRSLETPSYFNIQDAKVVDQFAEKLKDSGVHLWLTFFNFNVPYKDSLTPPERKILENYIVYLIARYGAYTDIWELVNECILPPELKKFMISVIEKYDFENRPVSTSFEDPGFEGIDIISPHWYESENLSESDTKTAAYIDSFAKYNKPVIFGEQGNAKLNWDESSALRMRVRLWTSFFKEGIIIFWNDVSKKSIPQVSPFYANIYIGTEERKYIKNLQDFTSGFPLQVKPENININTQNVRGYALKHDQKLMAAYFYNSLNTTTEFVFSVITLPNSKIIWYNPADGKVVKEDICLNGNCILKSPNFHYDIAIKISSNDN